MRWVLLCLGFIIQSINAEILTPPYFNLAEGKEIIASATCGVDTPGPELYCKLVGANSDQDTEVNLIQGQVCDVCDPTIPEKFHPPEHAVDGMETWWQSPPLSRGMKYNEVNLTINLGQEFHVAYVYIRMGNSPRPGLWVLEKSKDYGKTWQPWQYFSDSASDCLTYFGVDSRTPITRDDSVICTTEYSKIVPLEGGEIPISILNNRPAASHYFNSSLLQEWTRATNVRFRFLRTKNLLGHLMSVARQDPTVTRRYFYSIKDISIGGRCMCNGHADTCDIRDPKQPKKLECICQHNTYGPQCASCLPGFQQKKWQISTAFKKFTCEPCNCFGHSTECIYDPEVDEKHLSLDIHGAYEGGGVCQNCAHNTQGINCNQCKPKYFRPEGKPLNATDVCQRCDCDFFYSTGNCAESTGKCECRQEFTAPDCDSCAYGYFGYPNCRPCECHLGGTDGYHCEAVDGSCPCKQNYAGAYCNLCAEGYYKFPECLPCECNPQGSLNDVCDVVTGNCTCKNNYGGRTCDICEDGYYNYPVCNYCNCDARGTEPQVCNKRDGSCLCKEGYGGARCDQCISGYYGYPNCRPCNCSSVGSSSISCDVNGKCSCLGNFAGRSCDQCSPGYFMYPDCISCNCDSHGSIGVSCDTEGKCQCHENFDGLQCDQCKEGFYNFPRCEGCNCDPAGVPKSFTGCGSLPAGELCQCKDRVQGRICNQCKPLYWNLQQANPDGCEDCNCNIPGVIGSIGECDTKSGQCICKPGVTSRACDQCVDGTYNLEESNLFGCSVCACDIGGSISSICDKKTGQCPCQPRVTGQTCTEPLKAHYFPTLHQFQYEVEDGRTPSNSPVRYGFAEDSFPGYSWKGYAVFSALQNEIIQRVYISKPSLNRMVLRFVNKNSEPVLGNIKITPDNPQEIEQTFKVQLKPTNEPAFVTVAGVHGNLPATMVMNPGYWSISIATEKNLFLDYFVLLPAEYYEATILTQDVDVPCEIGQVGLCRHYDYPNVKDFDSVHGSGGFLDTDSGRFPLTEYFTDYDVLSEIGQDEIPLINDQQKRILFEFRVSKPGSYILLVTYVTSRQDKSTSTLLIGVNTSFQGKATLYPCKYTSICRQVVTDRHGKIAVSNFSTNYATLVLTGEPHSNIAVESIVAIPYERWSLDYIKPKSVCVRKNGKCVQGIFPGGADAKKVEFEAHAEDVELDNRPPGIFDNTTKLIYLDNNNNAFIDIKTKVPQPGDYVFVIQYYQPNNPEFELEVIVQNGKFYESKVAVPHCPSNSGCRSIIRQLDGNLKFQLIENVVISLKNPGPSIWLDYLLIIPADQYDDKVLKKIQIDQTKEFIKRCGNNHFHINTTDDGFCRDSIFSLTANYNNGALPCHCSAHGTTSFECDKFGGQCPCKPNIIGRRCEICKTGFYGYPNCRPCDCPITAICEPERGECICPSRVTGERCDQCEEGTYGFHPIIGCEECNCSPAGVLNGDMQCDLLNGTCKCKENVVGRQCDKCQNGYTQFPYCEACDCDFKGTTAEICDQYTAECYCKANVDGSACDICKPGTFNLQEDNAEGCSKCFCFGKTTRCDSANLYRAYEYNMIDWDVALVNDKTGNVTILTIIPQEYNDTSIMVSLTNNETFSNIVYFSAPSNYLGKKLTSYGGTLNYTVFYSTGPFGKAIAGPDVILMGSDSVLLHYGEEQPPSFTNFGASVALVESNFITMGNVDVTREQMLVTLENLKGVYIRGTYWEPSIAATLSDVTMDTTTDTYIPGSEQASSVEQCQCPPNYQGLSCEECAPGYYRVESGPYGGSCVRCQCNGHADTCDVKTGICHNCKNGTTGDHCEFCEQGYYGNATIGTPTDCLICACPLPIASNNFATGCEVNEAGNKISCDCLPGYYGARCESCAAGFYGDPNIEGEFCKLCECSGNIDTNDIGSCDSITGECLHCLNNTYGEACNLCAPGFYGDAVERKDCRTCQCESCGMERCDSYNGLCECKINVIGEKCDRCAENHFGFNSCNGCQACDCGLASEYAQCDLSSGQCKCKPGVTGRKCDRCIAGFWNYGPEGCTSCNCNTGYSLGASCNTTTGQCSCLPGVIGEKCDHCPYRWVLKEGDGCYECDSCIDDLLDVTDQLEALLSPVAQEFNTVAESYYTNQRLKFVNDSVNELYPDVKLLDSSRIDFVPLQQEITKLDQEVSTQKRRVEYTADDSMRWKNGAENTLVEMNNLETDVRKEINSVNTIISEIQYLATNIGQGTAAKIDSALKEANEILNKIKNVSFVTFRDKAIDQSDHANGLVSEMTEYNFPVSNLSSAASKLGEKIHNFSMKVDDFYIITAKADELTRAAEKLIDDNKRSKGFGNFDSLIKNATTESQDDIITGQNLNKNATMYLNEADDNFKTLRDLASKNQESLDQLNNTLNQNDDDLLDVIDIVGRADEHAENLYVLSIELDNILNGTRNTSAVRAVSAYRDIERAIQEARDAAYEAAQAATNATALSNGIDRKTSETLERSSKLLSLAESALATTEGKLEADLDQAQEFNNYIAKQNKKNTEALDRINSTLNQLSLSTGSPMDDLTQEANEIEQTINNSMDRMDGVVNKISNDLKDTKNLTKDTTDSMRDVSQAKKQLDSVSKVLPNMADLLSKLGETQNSIDVTGNDLKLKIEALKNKIANARELADRFKIGVTFYRNTTLQLKNPESLPLLATSTKLSLYFRTDKANGFLLYLGNEDRGKVTRHKTHDFLALMIEGGYPVLIIDLGSGPVKIINNKYVSDNVWRQIIVDRTGKNVKLIVREDIGEGRDEQTVKEQVLPGTYSIFNLDQEHSKLFVGGYPTSFQTPDVVTASSFEGQMEDLVIGDIPVSFWNFIKGENNQEGAMERDKLIDFTPSTGYRFDRNGFAVLSMKNSQIRHDPSKFSLKMNFKTFAEDGLMYLMGKGRHFLALEMKNGQVLYQFDLGDGPVALISQQKYNDGEWHTLEARRLGGIGLMEIDGFMVAKNEIEAGGKTLAANDHIYVGGYPPNIRHSYRSVSNLGFEGCIDEVVILDTSVDLSRNSQAFGVMPGCPVRFASLVSFEEDSPGYVKWQNVTADPTLQVNLKFKTTADNGLIFYATDADQTSNSALSIEDGVLVFKSQGEVVRSSSAGNKFNDNEWHVVTATHDDTALRIDIDDIDNFVTDYPPPALSIRKGNLYIGGLPNAPSGSKSTEPFVGCIGDATLNGEIINFANTKERPNAFLGKCLGGETPAYLPTETDIGVWPPPPVTGLPETITMASTKSNIIDVEVDTVEPGPNEVEGRVTLNAPLTEAPTEEPDEPEEPEKPERPERPVEPMTTPAPPYTVDSCKLPYMPAVDPESESGWRFGTARNSRLEYGSLNGRYKDDYDLQIDLKTAADEGIIFYSSAITKNHFIAVYIQGGRVHYSFDCGTGPAWLKSEIKINDNQWHTIVFKRSGNFGELIVDENLAVAEHSQGNAATMDVNPPFYLGGILPELSANVQANIGTNKTFNGCLSNFMMNGQPVGDPDEKVGVIPCSNRVESGVFFYPGNGSNLFRAMDKFTVGRSVDIQMDIKPRSTSGHLLSVHGKRDFLLLEMVNGTIKFLVKTTKGPIETSFVPKMPNSLCDGNWHNIRAVKQKNAVLLSVDHAAAPPGIGNKNSAGVLSKHPIFIGGHPLLGKRLRGSTSHSQYVGCIKNIIINSNEITPDPERAFGHVTTGVCPII
ncbi:laminin subunit alpha [Microplitis demolitor]|uniref:laminin subunit alpha n=1 Tax=Microplitis demolitor TaxID=69319 RepID=UPI0004CCF006|nr:laminin subunit alpha [Microplitis demolitor]